MRKILAVFLFGVLASGAALAGEDSGWQLLMENKFPEAKTQLAREVESAPHAIGKLAALEGLCYCTYLLGEDQEFSELRVRMAKLAAELDGVASRFFFNNMAKAADQWLADEDYLKLLREFDSDRYNPGVRRIARDVLHAKYLSRREYEQAEAIEKTDGYIRRYAAVIGFFSAPAGEQVDLPTALETDPGATELTNAFGEKVRHIRNVDATRNGSLEMGDYLPQGGRNGIIYALALVKSGAAREAMLQVSGPESLRIWLRGQPVYRGDAYRGDYRRSPRNIVVRLQEGLNPLVIKTANGVSFSLRLVESDMKNETGILTGLSWEDFDGAEFSKYPCRQIKGVLFSREQQFSLREAVDRLSAPEPAKSFWQMRANHDLVQPQEEREVLDRLLEKYPQSLLALVRAETSRRTESELRIDDKDRLNKEAMDFLARARAVRADDYRTLLATAGHYHDGKQTRQALELYKKAVETLPEGADGRVFLAQMYAEKQWNALAEAEYKKYVELMPEREHLLAEFYKKTGRASEASALFEKLWKQKRLSVRARLDILKEEKRWDEAESLLEEWIAAFPSDKRWRWSVRLWLAREKGDVGLEEKYLLEKADFDSEDEKLAVDLGEFYLRRNDQEKAVQWFHEASRRSLATDDIDLDLQRRLRKLTGQEWDLPQYDLKLDEAETGKISKADHPSANYAVALRLVVRRIYENRASESLVHNALKVFDENGIGQLGEMSVPQESDNLLFCRTVQPDGTVYVPTSVENLDLGKATSMYNVKPGSVLEYAYRETEDGGRDETFSDTFEAEEIDVPIIRGRYVLIVPKKLVPRMSLKVYPDSLVPEVSDQGDDRIFTWDVKNVKGRKQESNTPSYDKILANVSVTIRGEEYGSQRYYFGESEDDRIYTDSAIDKKALELVAGTESIGEKVNRIYAWIATEIKDTGGGRTARDVFALRSGDPGAKARLARAMLAAAGCETSFVTPNSRLFMPGTSRRDRVRIIDDFYGQQLLRVSCPEQGDFWLHFGNPARNFRPGDIGYGLIGAPCLEKSRDGVKLLYVRKSEQETLQNMDLLISLLPDGDAKVTGKLLYHGSWAGVMRTSSEKPQQGAQMMERLASRIVPRLTVDETKYPEPDFAKKTALPEREPFVFNFSGKVKSFCRNEGDGLTFNPFLYPCGANQFVAPLPRENDFEIGRDCIASQELVYEIPEGWAFKDVPPDCYWRGEFALYCVDFNIRGRKLFASRFLIIPSQKLKPDEYLALHGLLAEIEKTERAGVSLVALGEEKALLHEAADFGVSKIMDMSPFQARYWPKQLAEATDKQGQE
jgi:tetratricopeptide (TPR) repeat protein